MPKGDLVLDLLATQLGSDVTPGLGQTVFSDGWTKQSFDSFVVAGSYKPASSPVTMTWTPSRTVLGDGWAHVAVALQPSPTGVAPVGGFVEPVNNLAIAAPYLAFFGVIAAAAVVVWKKRDT